MDLIFETLDKNRLYVKYTGKIYIENSESINNEIQAKLGNVKELVFDFAEVPYISSAGLRMLHSVYKALQLQKEKGSLYIKNANNDVKNVIEISGFKSFITVL